MGRRVFQTSNWTPTATADTSALANATYMAIKGSAAGIRTEMLEFYIAGMASASAITALSFGLSSTLAITPTALAAPASDGVMDRSGSATAAVTFTAAGTGGQRSAVTTDAKLMLGLNAFGGIVRWQAGPDLKFSLLGAAVSVGEAYLSSQNIAGAGLINAHMIYEPA